MKLSIETGLRSRLARGPRNTFTHKIERDLQRTAAGVRSIHGLKFLLAHALQIQTTHQHGLSKIILRDHEIQKTLIIALQNIIKRFVCFNLICFEHERLDHRRRLDVINADDFRNEISNAAIMRFYKIRSDAFFQTRGFADVHEFVISVVIEIHSRMIWENVVSEFDRCWDHNLKLSE